MRMDAESSFARAFRDVRSLTSCAHSGIRIQGGCKEEEIPVADDRSMSRSSRALLDENAAFFALGSDEKASATAPKDGWPRLIVRVVDEMSVVDIVDVAALFDSGVVVDLNSQLNRLVEEGHTRMLLNFSRVRYISADVLGTLAVLYRRIRREHGRLALCGLDPILRDMLRI